MKLADKVVVVTGGANGIGLALCRHFKAEGARGIGVADLDEVKAVDVARELDALAIGCDVSREEHVRRAIDETEARFGPIDLFCSNAGLAIRDPDPDNAASAPDEHWDRCWRVHVMAHVFAARALVPRMIARGGGYFLQTVSAAGLLNQIGSATYGVTKHAAIGFAENLALTHRDHGIKVSVLCPQGVRTALLGDEVDGRAAAVDGILTPEAVADSVIDGLARESFLILPHPQVADYMRRKTTDYDRWIGGMAKLRRSLRANAGS